MRLKVGDYVENIKYQPQIYLYGLIIDIDPMPSNPWIAVLTLKNDGCIFTCDFKEYELELLTDKNKINHFNKLRVFK